MADSGIGTDFELTFTNGLTIIAFLSIAMYNSVELSLMIFMYFKRRHSLYFWSVLVSTVGILIYSLGFMFKFFSIIPQAVISVTFIVVGWCSMVTGQSLVLYSRLHLIMRNTKILRFVLIMIIVDAIICHVPITVLVYGSNSSNSGPYVMPYSIYEKVQVTIFFIQECIISGLYVSQTIKTLRLEGNIRGKTGRTLLVHLIYMNMIIIIMDITLLGIEYAGLYHIQTTFKAAVYGVKLKMEFSILNKLVKLVQGKLQGSSSDPRSRSHRQTGVDNPNHVKSSRMNGEAGTTTTIALGPYTKPQSPEPSDNFAANGVYRTTEITVEHGEPGTSDEEREGRFEGNGGPVPENSHNRFSLDRMHRRRQSAASSSEVQFAKSGF